MPSDTEDAMRYDPPLVHEAVRPRLDPGPIARLVGLSGLAAAVSDELDARGLRGAVPARLAPPLIPNVRIIGPVLTLRYLPERYTVARLIAEDTPGRLGNAALSQVARPGDVAVIEGRGGGEVSLLGGVAAKKAQAVGIIAVLVDGAVRDVDEIVPMGLPVWASARTPITGGRRMEAVELNGWVSFCGIQVRPGDVAVADDSGICFVPLEEFPGIVETVLGDA